MRNLMCAALAILNLTGCAGADQPAQQHNQFIHQLNLEGGGG